MKNIYMLESNIYQLTDLLQEEIQYYIYYESANMESVRQELDDQVRGFHYHRHSGFDSGERGGDRAEISGSPTV